MTNRPNRAFFFLFLLSAVAATTNAFNIFNVSENASSVQYDSCDDSQCLEGFIPGYPCLAAIDQGVVVEPLLCQAGYTGVTIQIITDGEFFFQKYTCCPFGEESDQDAEPTPLECDDSVCRDPNSPICNVALSILGAIKCESEEFVYPHILGTYEEVPGETSASYTCCNAPTLQGELTETYPHLQPGCSSNPCSDFLKDCLVERDFRDSFERMGCGDDRYKYPIYLGDFDIPDYKLSAYTCCESDEGKVTFADERNFWIYAISLLAIALPTCLLSAQFCYAILSSRSKRRSAFDLYLFFSIIPDALYNTIVVIVCIMAMLALNTEFSGEYFLVTAEFAGFVSMWTNAVIIYEVYTLLWNSKNCRRVPPPLLRKAILQVVAVYALALGWTLLDVLWLYNNFVLERSGINEVIHEVIKITILGGIPFLYMVYVGVRIWRNNLMPLSGRTRSVAIYLLRVVVSYVCFFVPLIIVRAISIRTEKGWARASAYLLVSVDGLVNVIFARDRRNLNIDDERTSASMSTDFDIASFLTSAGSKLLSKRNSSSRNLERLRSRDMMGRTDRTEEFQNGEQPSSSSGRGGFNSENTVDV